MIEINLLPQGLKLKDQRLKFMPEKLVYLIPLVFAILIAVHIYLAASALVAGYRFRSLTNKWRELEPQRTMVESASKEFTGLTQDTLALQQLLKERVSWAEKLNLLSINLSTGIWFDEIRITGKDFSLKGRVFSITKQEVGQINKFLDNLKTDNNFFRDFSSLELGPLQKIPIGSYEVTEFTISGKLK